MTVDNKCNPNIPHAYPCGPSKMGSDWCNCGCSAYYDWCYGYKEVQELLDKLEELDELNRKLSRAEELSNFPAGTLGWG